MSYASLGISVWGSHKNENPTSSIFSSNEPVVLHWQPPSKASDLYNLLLSNLDTFVPL